MVLSKWVDKAWRVDVRRWPGSGNALPYFVLVFLLCSCNNKHPLFKQLTPARTGIDFVNRNEDTDSMNILDYLYYYNGAGVAAGDINNDGLPDLYFTSNRNGNRLYLNKGDLHFEDITESAGVKGTADWTTGVSMADVNGDGLLDIYVCTVSNVHGNEGTASPVARMNGKNELFINRGNGRFSEQAHQWNLDIEGYNTQSAFLDYDHDGDLDLFLLQHSVHQTGNYGDTTLRSKYSAVSGGKLYRNDGARFTDVTAGSGIISSALGYGLGVAVADFDHNGWDDIYVGNDFHENDYYYLNSGGVFREQSATAFGHQSNFSMGNDAADINNDGWIDLLTLDMLPADEKVLKSSPADAAFDIYAAQRRLGYGYQYSRNCLQLNTASGKRFSEIGLYSGLAATDWSWAALAADFDLDGYKDVFITNGIKRRLNDLDYIKFVSDKQGPFGASGRANDKAMLEKMPDGKWHNYMFKGSESLRFEDVSGTWGFETENLSNGAAYADLDGDGDLDLITNNINEAAGIYENTATALPGHRYLRIHLEGKDRNTFATGAKAFVFARGKMQFQELQPERGFLSSVEPILSFGLANEELLDSLVIIWPDQQVQRLYNVKTDQLLTCRETALTETVTDMPAFIRRLLHEQALDVLQDMSAEVALPVQHQEDLDFVDFSRQPFIPHEVSTEGPHVAVADVNGDGRDDFFYCGAKGQPGSLWLQRSNGTFAASSENLFAADAGCEDVDALFFDADNDGDKDLYVVSGGNEYSGSSPLLQDRLYLNDGQGNFAKSITLPAFYENKSTVCAADIDHDGDMDLFVGGRVNSGRYGLPPSSWLLINDGKANFSIASKKLSGELATAGMVTDAAFCDLDGDGWEDLVVVGEWMAPAIYKNEHGNFVRQVNEDVDKLTGWWHTITVADVNGDGKPDLLLGNFGTNSKLAPPERFPLKMVLKDLDGDGSAEQMMITSKNGKYYTFLGKENLESRLPYLKKQFLSYTTMAGKTSDEVFSGKLRDAPTFSAASFQSVVLLNNGGGRLSVEPLPAMLQWSSVYAFAVADLDGDGRQDIFAGGNFFGVNPYEGRYDALMPSVYSGDGKGHFQPRLPVSDALARIGGEVRDIQKITIGKNQVFIVARNNLPLVFLKVSPESRTR